jgi:predicted nucleic acid-binding protein
MGQSSVEVLMPSMQTVDIFAGLQDYAKRTGRSLSDNDIWIAALTQEVGDTLVTYDNDFSAFREQLGDKLIVLSH